MIEKNKEYIVDIVAQGYEGEGIGKLDGNFTMFVEGALRGERVKVKAIKVKKNYAYGKLVETLETSEERVEPICPIYKRCGGCRLQHTSYNEQLNFKTERVRDCITKIGKLNGDLVRDTIGMDNPYRYRNKVQLPIGLQDGKLTIGFFAPRSHEIIDMESCYIQDEIADKVVTLTRSWIEKNNIRPYFLDGNYDESGILRHIMIRRGFKTNEVMVVIVTNGTKLPGKEEFINLMKLNIPGIKSIIQNINDKKSNVILGQESLTLWGQDTISDYIGEFKFNISPLSFFQVNPVQTEVLYSKALEFAALEGEETVFDAYCGTGTITLFLSQKAKKVYGVEIIQEAIDNAWINAEENSVSNVEFYAGESEKVIPDLIAKGIKADVVVVDPPRKGCDRKLLEAITSIDADRIVYVSCDPSTLARDLAIIEDLGYKTVEVQPVDMFPQTSHVECVVGIRRKDSL
ncbi:23S rRNA (uracil(1939)-C(5))-methyltransferase RlmD [Clostridium manihotivorum]|uniref:23S rRNA (Uracil(1939)-C(5))-methyltransferase RlmD n=1 Tax=Clostridium manihotivorum TaxID=2320868 RepID=A0A3R5QY32_9CLOT|nr:23S rRNA (uracil(1939)-C(5))-methyltransferase RlmD [Clostridium manihotivorum]QAA34954.1 23S rRNA (uracil(1939)-C(5))-methyltransferase RlmD [Clostridium manihotivorum]